MLAVQDGTRVAAACQALHVTEMDPQQAPHTLCRGARCKRETCACHMLTAWPDNVAAVHKRPCANALTTTELSLLPITACMHVCTAHRHSTS